MSRRRPRTVAATLLTLASAHAVPAAAVGAPAAPSAAPVRAVAAAATPRWQARKPSCRRAQVLQRQRFTRTALRREPHGTRRVRVRVWRYRCVRRPAALPPASGAQLPGARSPVVIPVAVPSVPTTVVQPLVPVPPTAAPAPQPASQLGVVEREWVLRPTTALLKAGIVTVNVTNYGEDAHDLAFRPDGAGATIRLPLLQSRESTEQEVPLSAGPWIMFCTLPGHEAAGMRSNVTVR